MAALIKQDIGFFLDKLTSMLTVQHNLSIHFNLQTNTQTLNNVYHVHGLFALKWGQTKEIKREMISYLHTELQVIPRRDIHKITGCLQSKYSIIANHFLTRWKNNYWLWPQSDSRCDIQFHINENETKKDRSTAYLTYCIVVYLGVIQLQKSQKSEITSENASNLHSFKFR